MRYFSFLALSFALVSVVRPPAALAEMLPAYDMQTMCGDLAGTSIRQEMVMRGCLDFQERMRKEVALAWDKVPAPVQSTCSKAANASGDYWRLKSCIDKESSAAAH